MGTIPDPVIGGVSIVIFGLIACNALKMLVEHAVDMTDSRNLIIFGRSGHRGYRHAVDGREHSRR